MVFMTTNQQGRTPLEVERGVLLEAQRKPFFSKNYNTTANIAAGATSAQEFVTEGDQFDAAPFDTIVIANRDSVDVEIQLDQNPENSIPVKAGFTISADNQQFRNISIKNLDGASVQTAGKLNILIQNTKFPRRG